MLITFEGGECSGKDTQIVLLTKALAGQGYTVHSHFWEPGSTLKAEVIRLLLKNKFDSEFEFPGDFRKTFDLGAYTKEFEAEPVPEIAADYMRQAMHLTKEGMKFQTIGFLLDNTYMEHGSLETAIKFYNSDFSRQKTSHPPADLMLANHFSKEPLSAESQMYLYMAARNILHHSHLKDALKEYDIIIMNRSRDSSAVYQGHAQNPALLPTIRNFNIEATEGIIPSMTLAIDLPVEEVFKRKNARSETSRYTGITKDFFDEKEAGFHEKVRKGYLDEVAFYKNLPKDHPEFGRLQLIDGVGTPQQVHDRIYNTVMYYLRPEK